MGGILSRSFGRFLRETFDSRHWHFECLLNLLAYQQQESELKLSCPSGKSGPGHQRTAVKVAFTHHPVDVT
uniref:Uncharacterized protein n=1 Tax=Tetraselmis sp. GSL018 TaxID=582737 RepID=A0A061R303_9CHLO